MGRPTDTPTDAKQKHRNDQKGEHVDTSYNKRLVGKLIYLSDIQPVIAFAVSLVSQFMHSPYIEHLEAGYQMLRYLKSVPRTGPFLDWPAEY